MAYTLPKGEEQELENYRVSSVKGKTLKEEIHTTIIILPLNL